MIVALLILSALLYLFCKKYKTLTGTLFALSVATLVCKDLIQEYIDVTSEIKQSTEMIDPKYLDMLRKNPSVQEKVSEFLKDTIDDLITCAICDFSSNPLPPSSKFRQVSMGTNKLNKRELIVGELKEGNASMCVEFSDDYKTGYVSRTNGFDDYQEITLSPDSSHAVKSLFDSVHSRIIVMSKMALREDPIKVALEEFLSEIRYGSNEYLCNEFLDIYKKAVKEQLSYVDNQGVVDTLEGALLSLKVRDITQFLSDNGIDPKIADVHIID